MKKIIILIYILFLSLAINAEDKSYKDNVVAIVNNDIITNSQIVKHMSLLNFLIKMNSNKPFLKYSLTDLIDVKLQLRLTEKNSIDISREEIKNTYEQCAKRKNLSISEYEKEIKDNNLNVNEVNLFIKEDMMVEKLHEKLLHPHISVSTDELNHYLELSNNNYNLIKSKLSQCKIIKFEMNKNSDDEVNLINIGKVLKFLGQKKFKNENRVNLEGIQIESKIYKIDKFNKENKIVKADLINSIEKDIIGPLFVKNKIIFLKIINKNVKENKKEIRVKVGYFYMPKYNNKFDPKKISKIKKQTNKLKKIKNIIDNKTKNKYLRIKYLDELTCSDNLKEKIRKLEKNDISKIIKTKNGWYIIKIINKERNINSKVSKKIISDIKVNKLLKSRKEWIRAIKKDSYVRINVHNENF